MISNAAISLGTWLAVFSLLFAAVAAGAGVLAVYFAHETVTASQDAARAADKRHAEQVSELQALSSSAHAAHEDEMQERRVALDREIRLRGLQQLQRVSEVLRDLIDAAREERSHPSERVTDVQPGRALSSTPVQMLQVQLRIEVRVLRVLGGPDLSEVIPREERDDQPVGLERLWFGGVEALEKVLGYIDVYGTLGRSHDPDDFAGDH